MFEVKILSETPQLAVIPLGVVVDVAAFAENAVIVTAARLHKATSARALRYVAIMLDMRVVGACVIVMSLSVVIQV
jgi:hypothetical protein